MRKISNAVLLTVSLFFGVFSHAQNETNGFDDLVVFSGSFNDTGNYASLIGGLPPIFWENRLADGPLIVDFMSENLGLPISPSFHLEGEPQGNNYSLTDAWAGRYEQTDLSGMLDAYFAKTDNTASENTLYFLWMGSHDVIETISAPGPIDYTMLDDAVKGVEVALYRLINAGAKHIFAPNFADVGFAPAFQRAGITDRVTEVADYYNYHYNKMINRVEYRSRQRIYRFDFDKYMKSLITNYAFFGLTNVDTPCFEILASGGQCDLNSYAFYTDVLITSRVHNMIADAFTQDLLHQVASCRAGNWHAPTRKSVCTNCK